MSNEEVRSRGDSDEDLLADHLAGRQDAFAALVRRHSRELYVFVSRFVRDPEVAEDVVQEAFIQVHQSAGGFDPCRRFRPWLYTIAANKARDHLRSRGRRREVSLSSPVNDEQDTSFVDLVTQDSATPPAALEAREQQAIVRAIVDAMPVHLREILLLGYFHRFPYKEMAEMLSIPLGTVKSRLHAAVAHFASAYQRAEQQRAKKD